MDASPRPQWRWRLAGGALAIALFACAASAASALSRAATEGRRAGLGIRAAVLPRHAARALACIGSACDLAPAAMRMSAARGAEPGAPTLADWHRLALNALLEPLLQPDEPLRWAEPSLVTPCADSGTVTIDGKPPVPGALLPREPFVMRWRLADCAPIGLFSLNGEVVMRLHREPAQLRAEVLPQNLVVVAAGRRFDARQPFVTTLSLAASPQRE